MAKVDRYRVNDVLSGLAAECGVTLDDDTLNDLTHHVADVLEQEDETDDSEERGDICMALREAGAPMAADEAGGMTIEDAREAYRQVMGKPWRWRDG
jgi:hypothetical protein